MKNNPIIQKLASSEQMALAAGKNEQIKALDLAISMLEK